jgi:hypothetical protein
MAKGKKSSGKHYTSKGERSNVARWLVKENRREYMQSGMRQHNQLLAYMAGKNVVLTIPNPNTNETNKRFIRVPANEVWKTVRRK